MAYLIIHSTEVNKSLVNGKKIIKTLALNFPLTKKKIINQEVVRKKSHSTNLSANCSLRPRKEDNRNKNNKFLLAGVKKNIY